MGMSPLASTHLSGRVVDSLRFDFHFERGAATSPSGLPLI